MLTAESVYQIAKELTDKEMVLLHKRITADVNLFQSLKKRKQSNRMSNIEMRNLLLEKVFKVELIK
ncbi:hypothetical protein JCM19275_3159 [Nonlabens ulvanivorans]|uniref:Uncharacterized protein n=1 Tax=Nonlabens ulvanivorans TaxID=906888 RepID=A0A090WFW3_NONUL|nr:hypothetical protein [Nonlabens ulvanivorans]GAL74304.1 hypothetical protein JCM19275_3159 [Nonlabens ulvanivorans]